MAAAAEARMKALQAAQQQQQLWSVRREELQLLLQVALVCSVSGFDWLDGKL
jgi:hypothetical protein